MDEIGNVRSVKRWRNMESERQVQLEETDGRIDGRHRARTSRWASFYCEKGRLSFVTGIVSDIMRVAAGWVKKDLSSCVFLGDRCTTWWRKRSAMGTAEDPMNFTRWTHVEASQPRDLYFTRRLQGEQGRRNG